MSPSVFQQFLALATSHQWLPLAILVVGLLVSWTRDTSKFPINIPARFQPLVALVLGTIYAVLQAVSSGTAWHTAIENGLLMAMSSAGFAQLLVNTVFNGKLPSWLSWLTAVDPALVAAKKAGKVISAPLFGRSKVVVETAKAA